MEQALTAVQTLYKDPKRETENKNTTVYMQREGKQEMEKRKEERNEQIYIQKAQWTINIKIYINVN